MVVFKIGQHKLGSFSKGEERREGKEGKRRKEEKIGEKQKRNSKKTKNRGMVGKKGNWKAKKDDFAVTNLGSFFKSGMGRLSKSIEQYTPLHLP